MINAIGIDIENISRIKKAMENPQFLKKCFTVSEQEYIISKKENSAQTAAGIFCAKEALMKALGVGIGKFSFCDIEVARETGGKPFMLLYNKAKILAGKAVVYLSISHTGDLATAQVILEDREV